jgi:outer membrane protein
MHKLLPLVLLIVSSICQAQTPAAHILPDGSTDMYLGMSVGIGPAYEGSKTGWASWALDFQGQWSNGIFVSGSKIGMHLSEDPGIEYGPLVAWGGKRPQSISPKTDGLGDIYSAPSVGVFYNYMLPNNVQLTTDLLYGTGRDRGGIVFDFGARKFFRVATHHGLSFWAGMTWANAEYTQVYYGITPQQALTSTLPTYTASANVLDMHAGVNWNWELSTSWLLNTRVYATHLMGSAVNSPLVERTDNFTVSTGLVYRF